ncbi:MAG: phosphate/phosphite/phosphonate ABC transporter substrate-binding protein, partial [Deltaproteobacteria bacterium]|nr:phosphate/phosphite/phosphonate ABC transporter substrate-binding protein [Candidatus Tharpellaceae bacterium]
MSNIISLKSIGSKPYGRMMALIAMLILSLPLISRAADSTRRQVVKIGVLANRGVSQCFEDWQPLADYLTDHDDANVLYWIEPLRFQDIDEAVQQQKIDFLITNPYIYVELAEKYAVERLATVVRKTSQGPSSVFGGVVFTRSGRDDICKLKDLRGKIIAAVSPDAFAAWIAVRRELHAQGIDPRRDFAKLTFYNSMDRVVLMVRTGQADVGFIRTGILEKMAAEGKIK